MVHGWGFHLFGLAACVAGGYYAARNGFFIAALLMLPLGAWFAARILVETGMATFDWLNRGQMATWNGRFYEYSGHQLRPVELEVGLAFFERDVLGVVELKDPAVLSLFGPAERLTDPESGEKVLTRAGCERLLLKSTHPESKRLLLWLRRDVFAPYDKRRARAG